MSKLTRKGLSPKFQILLLILAVTGVACVQITRTLAKYETVGTAKRDVDVAFWVVNSNVQTEDIILNELYPSATPFEYTFSVSNFNEAGKRAETDMEYDISLVASTYLPLEYEVVKKGADGKETTCVKTEQFFTEDNSTYYKKISLTSTDNNFNMDRNSSHTDTFIIKVTFPQKYSANSEYADLIEDIKINLSARQIIGE